LSRSRVSRATSPVRYHPNEPPRWPGARNAGSAQQAEKNASGRGNIDPGQQVAYLDALPDIQLESGESLALMAQPLAHPPQQSYLCELPLASRAAKLPIVPLADGSINMTPGTAAHADGSSSIAGGEHASGIMAGWQPGTLVEPVMSNTRCADDVRLALPWPQRPALAPDGRPLLEPRPVSDLMLPGWQSPGKGFIASPLQLRRSPSPGIQQSWRRAEPQRAASPPARPGWGPRVVEVKRYPSPSPRQPVRPTENCLLSKPVEAQPASHPKQTNVTPPRRRFFI